MPIIHAPIDYANELDLFPLTSFIYIRQTINTAYITRIIEVLRKKGETSPTGNRTPVSRVTGGDTHHYTIEDWSYFIAL